MNHEDRNNKFCNIKIDKFMEIEGFDNTIIVVFANDKKKNNVFL